MVEAYYTMSENGCDPVRFLEAVHPTKGFENLCLRADVQVAYYHVENQPAWRTVVMGDKQYHVETDGKEIFSHIVN